MYDRKRALFINMPVLDKLGLYEVNKTSILINVFQDMFGIMMMRFWPPV